MAQLTPEEELRLIRLSITILAKLQSTLHDIDKMLESPVKRELKMKLKGFQSFLENHTEKTFKHFNLDASESMTSITMKLDQLTDEVNLIITE